MSPRTSRVRELFDGALQRPAPEREAWVRDEAAGAGDDPALVDEVVGLLAFEGMGGGPLDTPLLDADRLAAARRARDDGPTPERVGPYTVVRVLGRGSMGTVYEALQENPRRTVALKVLRAGPASESALRRFQLEIDALARLDHPFVASIHEAGTTEVDGVARPYLAMEHVDGLPLSADMRRRRRTVREALALLADIGEGVAHAHARGVVHRDLKPDNVLVDADGRPRILDFGVARLNQGDGAPLHHATADGVLVGTLPAMSPEQASGDVARVDVRSDVYALGVLGYELLTGRPPYDLEGLDLADALTVIKERDAVPAGEVVPALSGDVETVLAKAMDKDPARRYQTAAEFVADVRRVLADEPVLARPPSTSDQLRRFARRNRALAGGLAVGLALLLLGLVGMAWGLRQAHERNEANLRLLTSEREARASERAAHRELEAALGETRRSREALEVAVNDAESLTRFLTDVIVSVGADRLGWDVRLGDALDAAAAEASTWDATPLVRTRIDETLGRAYLSLGRYPDAVEQLERACAGWLALVGPDGGELLSTRGALGEALRQASRFTEAEELQRDLVARSERLLGPDDPATLDEERRLCGTLQAIGDFDDAEARLRDLLVRAERVTGADSELTLAVHNSLGMLLVAVNRYAEAREVFSGIVERRRELLGDDAIATLATRRELANLTLLSDEHAAALEAFTELEARYRERLGPDHPETIQCGVERAKALKQLARYDEARVALERAVAAYDAALGAGHQRTLLTRKRLASMLLELGLVDEADAVLRLLVDVDVGARPPDWWLGARREQGFVAFCRGEFGEARAIFEATLPQMRDVLGPRSLEVAHLLMDLSNIDMNERRMADAEARLVEAESIYTERLGPTSTDTLAARMNRALGYKATERYPEAERVLLEVLPQMRAHVGADHPSVARILIWIAEVFVSTGRAEQAVPLLDGSLLVLRPVLGDVHAMVLEARYARVDALEELGRVQEVEAALASLAADLGAAWPDVEAVDVATLDLLCRRAKHLVHDGDAEAAEAAARAALDAQQRLAPAMDWLRWDLRMVLARTLHDQGRAEERDALLDALREEAAGRWGAESTDAVRARAAPAAW